MSLAGGLSAIDRADQYPLPGFARPLLGAGSDPLAFLSGRGEPGDLCLPVRHGCGAVDARVASALGGLGTVRPGHHRPVGQRRADRDPSVVQNGLQARARRRSTPYGPSPMPFARWRRNRAATDQRCAAARAGRRYRRGPAVAASRIRFWSRPGKAERRRAAGAAVSYWKSMLRRALRTRVKHPRTPRSVTCSPCPESAGNWTRPGTDPGEPGRTRASAGSRPP